MRGPILLRHRCLWLALLAVVVAVGCDRSPPSGPEVERGRTLYLRVCATCHAGDGSGMPSLGKSLLDNSFAQGLTDDELIDFLKAGRAASHPLNETGIDMPPKGGDLSITDAELADLVNFLRTL